MSLPSTVYFINGNEKVIGMAFVNCGWVDNPASILDSVQRAYSKAKEYNAIKNDQYKVDDDRDLMYIKNAKDSIKRIEERENCELFPNNWENEWYKILLYNVVIYRSDLIKLGKEEINRETVEDSIRFQQDELIKRQKW